MPVSLMQQSIPKQFALLLAEDIVGSCKMDMHHAPCDFFVHSITSGLCVLLSHPQCWPRTSWAGAEWTSTTCHPSF
eukprot:625727-Rhodomonas_salina.1